MRYDVALSLPGRRIILPSRRRAPAAREVPQNRPGAPRAARPPAARSHPAAVAGTEHRMVLWPAGTRSRSIWGPVLGLLALALVVYGNNLANPMVSDDTYAIMENEAAH